MAGTGTTYGTNRTIDALTRVVGETRLVVVTNMVGIITGTIGVTNGRAHTTEAGLAKFTEHIIAWLARTPIWPDWGDHAHVTYLIAHTVLAIGTCGMTPVLVANHATRTRHGTIVFGTYPRVAGEGSHTRIGVRTIVQTLALMALSSKWTHDAIAKILDFQTDRCVHTV
jgi:hypothetical protein